MNLPDFLTTDDLGDIQIAGHRVGLYHIVSDYNQGYSPEMLACAYPSVPLATIHKVLGFYLENRDALDRYVSETQVELDRQEAVGKCVDLVRLRERLAKRQNKVAVEPVES